MNPSTTAAVTTTAHPSGDPRFASLDETIARYHAHPDALIQVLHAAQQLFGFLGPDVLRYIAHVLKLPVAQVYGVVTFYHFFTLVPRGKHQIMICRGTTCHVRGAQALLDQLEQRLQVRDGETTRDGMFSLHTARCIGACALAPAVAVDDDVYAKMTAEKAQKFVEKDLKKYV